LINGWNDYFESVLSEEDFARFVEILTDTPPEFDWPHSMNLSYVRFPSQTVIFGEKKGESPQAYMDFLQGAEGNDLQELEHGRHGAGKPSRAGRSNFAFADGSVRALRFGESITPVNLWTVSEQGRNLPPLPPEQIE